LDVASARLALSGAVAQANIDLYRNNALVDVAQRTEAQRQRILGSIRLAASLHRLQRPNATVYEPVPPRTRSACE